MSNHYVSYTIRIKVPVSASSELGGKQSSAKNFTKLEREQRYFLNALINRGAEVVSREEVAAEAVEAPVVPAAKADGKAAKAAAKS